MPRGAGGGPNGIESDMMESNHEVISFGLPVFFFRISSAP
jgi:hypothetical protein